MTWVVGDTGAATTWAPADQPTSTGLCFLLQENGDFVLQESNCKIIIHDDHLGGWEPGDEAGDRLDTSGGCDVLQEGSAIGSWVRGD